MKIIISFCFVFSIAVSTVFSQTELNFKSINATPVSNAYIECQYHYSLHEQLIDSTSNEQVIETRTTILQANSTVSKFWDWHSFKHDSIILTSVPELVPDSLNRLMWKYNFKIKHIFKPIILKNYPKGKISVFDDVAADNYVYEEEKSKLNWEMTDDTLTVCGYLCRKATVWYSGREWIAWYAPEISLSDGPWKLHGLPGLILKADDRSGTHRFEAFAIRQSNRPIYLSNSSIPLKISRDAFVTHKNKFEEDPKSFLMGNEEIIVLSGPGIVLVGGNRTNFTRNTVYSPLEY